MDSDGFVRNHVAEHTSSEEFFYHVTSCVESQLKDWDKDYHVYLVKLADYNLVVRNGTDNYNVTLLEEEIESLQLCGRYALDREIWRQLEKQGLPIRKDSGDYLKAVYV